jgi:hypothetical protein
MQMVKQEPGSNQCGLCVVALLTDQTREEMLAKFPDYGTKADYEWLNYMRHDLGLILEDPRDDPDFDKTKSCDGNVYNGHFKLPLGYRYYCLIAVPAEIAGRRAVAGESNPIVVDGEITHAVAIDERGIVFDPSTNVVGTYTLEEYVRHNHATLGKVRIASCHRIVST